MSNNAIQSKVADVKVYSRPYKHVVVQPDVAVSSQWNTDVNLEIPPDVNLTLTATGTWDIYGDPSRPCGPAGSGVTANNGGDNGDWPWAGVSEGCLLIYYDRRVADCFTEGDRISGGVYRKTVRYPGGQLTFGPNDNNVVDNEGSLSVRIEYDTAG